MKEDEVFMIDGMEEVYQHIARAQEQHGNFASNHEALGVALEEWTELIEAIHLNDLQAIHDEAIDLAAVLMRLAKHCKDQKRLIELDHLVKKAELTGQQGAEALFFGMAKKIKNGIYGHRK